MIRLLLILPALLLTSCGFRNLPTELCTPPTRSFLTTSDQKQLSLAHWNLQPSPETIIIGLHGITGAASDFRNLGKTLSSQSPKTTLYALNLRGNGWDPEPHKRGDIDHSDLWKRDLRELHQTLAARHPQASIIWMGESMGALITLHTASEGNIRPDGLILSSPVVSTQSLSSTQRYGLLLAATLAPSYRVSLAALAGGDFQATANSQHFQQSKTNPYDIEHFTLRFLKTLASLTGSMSAKAEANSLPVLILHGKKDRFTTSSEIESFVNKFPEEPTLYQFPHSYHLLFFDKNREQPIRQTLNWLAQ